MQRENGESERGYRGITSMKCCRMALNSLGFHKGLPGLPAFQSGSHKSPRVVPVWLIGASL